MAASWSYAANGNPVSFFRQSRPAEESSSLGRGAGDLHSYGPAPYSTSSRAVGAIAQYPSGYRQVFPAPVYSGPPEWQSGRYDDTSGEFPNRSSESQGIWNPINNSISDGNMPVTTTIEDTSMGSFSGLATMASTLPPQAQGSRVVLPQPGIKLSQGSFPRASIASSSSNSELPVLSTDFKGRPSWQSSMTGSYSHGIPAPAGLADHSIQDISSDDSSISPTNTAARPIYTGSAAHGVTYTAMADHSRAQESAYGHAFNGDALFGGRDSFSTSLYGYSMGSGSKPGHVGESHASESQLISNGDAYTRLPPQHPPAIAPSPVRGREYRKITSNLTDLPTGRDGRGQYQA